MTAWLENVRDWIASDNGLRVLKFALVLVFGLILSRLLRRWVSAIIDRSRIGGDLLVKKFLLRIASLSVLVFAAFIALDLAEVRPGTFVAGLGITSILIGLALKDTLANFASGVLLLIYRPFRAGDLIDVEGSQGIVEELTMVNMQMTTADGLRVIMPTSRVWGAKITNYSVSPHRRTEVILRVKAGAAGRAVPIVRQVIESDERVQQAPAPIVRVTGMVDSIAVITGLFWTPAGETQGVAADIYLRVIDAFKEEGVDALSSAPNTDSRGS
ncbi:MAG TPA: mechanosensitive ion channel domain-containing protein [Blastocatellia bacterium]|nr:mechanosensitive ion channel domain-containing protein [Blastocatellia bacterium]